MSKIDEILEGYKNGQLTYIDREGEHKIDVKEFIKTGSDNILQKLNRTESVLLKVANAAPEKLKWVNDYAMMKVINELYERVDDLSADLIAKDTEIERLNNEAAASQVAIETSDSIPKEEAEKLLERIEILQAQLNQVIVERDDMNEKYTALDERFNKSVEAYKTLKTKNDALNNILTNSTAEMETQYNALVKKYDELNDKYESLQSEAAIITNRHNEAVKQSGYEIESLTTRLDNAGKENLKLNNTINELQQIKNDLERELNSRNEELNAEYEKQQDLIAKLEEQYNNACEELNNLKESFGEATGRIRNLDSTNVELQNKVTEQDTLINSLNATIKELTDDITDLRTMNEEQTKENALMQARVRNSEQIEQRTTMFENAISNFLQEIGYDTQLTAQSDNKQQATTIHRMGDNQVVDFNLGQ